MSEETQNVNAEAEVEARGHRKVRVRIVVSDKQDKTLVVAVSRRAQDPLYKKVVKATSKYYAHDENNEAKMGDTVEIMETRPLSKLKRWRLVSIKKHAATN
jgi:small subunit ribosomal protein S17